MWLERGDGDGRKSESGRGNKNARQGTRVYPTFLYRAHQILGRLTTRGNIASTIASSMLSVISPDWIDPAKSAEKETM